MIDATDHDRQLCAMCRKPVLEEETVPSPRGPICWPCRKLADQLDGARRKLYPTRPAPRGVIS